jgi:Fur family ferric uptake transcriptional regulator
VIGNLTFSSEKQDLLDHIVETLRGQGIRLTGARKELLDVLINSPKHLTAFELAKIVSKRKPSTHLSTIYRNLENLEKLGIISHAHVGHGSVIYQIRGLEHSHFACEECGEIIDVNENIYSGFLSKAKQTLGFSPNPQHFAALGKCSACN